MCAQAHLVMLVAVPLPAKSLQHPCTSRCWLHAGLVLVIGVTGRFVCKLIAAQLPAEGFTDQAQLAEAWAGSRLALTGIQEERQGCWDHDQKRHPACIQH